MKYLFSITTKICQLWRSYLFCSNCQGSHLGAQGNLTEGSVGGTVSAAATSPHVGFLSFKFVHLVPFSLCVLINLSVL